MVYVQGPRGVVAVVVHMVHMVVVVQMAAVDSVNQMILAVEGTAVQLSTKRAVSLTFKNTIIIEIKNLPLT